MKKEMLTESALHKKERMLKYKAFSVSFSYPDKKFFSIYKDLEEEKVSLCIEYDRLFRAGKIYLSCAEHVSKNEFQRVNLISEIMGFYNAFGVKTDKQRPDSLVNELEFMYYIIFKEIKASEKDDGKEKSSVCLDAQKKFFFDYLYPAAKGIASKIISATKNIYYKEISEDFLDFIEKEKKELGG